MQTPEVNAIVARELGTLACMLKARGATQTEITSFENASHVVSHLVNPIDNLIHKGVSLASFRGVSDAAARTTAEIVARMDRDEFRPTRLPWNMIDNDLINRFAAIPGIGPVKARNLIRFLGVTSVDDLRTAAAEGRVAGVPGFGKKTQARLLSRLSVTLH